MKRRLHARGAGVSPRHWPVALAVGAAVLAASGAIAVGGPDAAAADAGQSQADPREERPGGDTTVFETGRNAFSFPAANLDEAGRTDFAIGNSFFRRNWVEAPSSTSARDGLGPHFIARSCGGCHIQDGRGAPHTLDKPLGQQQPTALLFRLSVPGADGKPIPEPTYGEQFTNSAVQGVQPEGRVRLRYRERSGRFADGEIWRLRQPEVRFTDLAYGPMHPKTMVSPRIAPQLIGSGLLDAIDADDILANVREQAQRPDAIKGSANRVFDPFQGEVIGRFGWKANTGSLAHQTAAAFHGDIGITSEHFPREDCTPRQTDCAAAPRGLGRVPVPGAPQTQPMVEIDNDTLTKVIRYQATLAVPARRDFEQMEVRRGQALFQAAQCAVCHRPAYTTGKQAYAPALARQRIYPYTDLLLHDMGPGLADHRPDGLANGRQWRTPPLWGIGLIPDVNGHSFLLHDGRARGVMEAILWHGGEAQASRDQVLKMSRSERDALVRFVNSL